MVLEDLTHSEYEKMMKRYVITGAQYMAPANQRFLDSLDHYAKVNDAEILVLPSYYKKTDEPILHERFAQYRIIDKDLTLNSNLQIKKFDVRPQSIEPITGLSRFARADRTTIFASPKQRIKVLPNDKYLPKVLMTTGFATKPQYSTGFAISSKAKHDHKIGAMVVEIKDNSTFHYRHIDSQVNGKFCDLNKMYSGKSVKTFKPNVVFGDIHAADLNKQVHKANLEMIKLYKPQNIILHDLFDGKSINHWSEKKQVDKVKEYDAIKLSLHKEAIITNKVLQEYASAMPKGGKVYVVKSNHDERIDRWLNEGRYIGEPQNNVLGHELYLAHYRGEDLVKYLLETVQETPKNVIYLPRDKGLKLNGFQVGYHGDERFNGGRGSITSIENAYGKSITAHSHTPQVLRDTYVVGTSTDLQLDYNTGNSGWMNTHALSNPLGKAQLVNVIKGKWTTYK